MQFSFGSFWLDVEKRQLLHRNQRIVLTRKALDILGILVQNAARLARGLCRRSHHRAEYFHASENFG
jgi:DNA-binding response OmpR family regulator